MLLRAGALEASTVSPYHPPSDEWLQIVSDCLDLQKIWHQCNGASAAYATFSLVEIQHFGSPGIDHNMRPGGLSTAGLDGYPTRREGSFLPILANPRRHQGHGACLK